MFFWGMKRPDPADSCSWKMSCVPKDLRNWAMQHNCEENYPGPGCMRIWTQVTNSTLHYKNVAWIGIHSRHCGKKNHSELFWIRHLSPVAKGRLCNIVLFTKSLGACFLKLSKDRDYIDLKPVRNDFMESQRIDSDAHLHEIIVAFRRDDLASVWGRRNDVFGLCRWIRWEALAGLRLLSTAWFEGWDRFRPVARVKRLHSFWCKASWLQSIYFPAEPFEYCVSTCFYCRLVARVTLSLYAVKPLLLVLLIAWDSITPSAFSQRHITLYRFKQYWLEIMMIMSHRINNPLGTILASSSKLSLFGWSPASPLHKSTKCPLVPQGNILYTEWHEWHEADFISQLLGPSGPGHWSQNVTKFGSWSGGTPIAGWFILDIMERSTQMDDLWWFGGNPISGTSAKWRHNYLKRSN